MKIEDRPDYFHCYYSILRCIQEDFEKASIKFFDASAEQDRFFSNITPVWNYLLKTGRLADAEKIWQDVTELALKWEEQHNGCHIHKGTPFYFWAATAILRGNLDHGYVLMHQAVMEDIRTTQSKSLPDLPAVFFVTLDYQRSQYLQAFVDNQAKFLDGLLAEYCKSYNKTFDLNGFKQQFLANRENVEAVFMFVYTLARLINISHVPNYAIKSPFAGQLEMNILSDLALVIEVTIQRKNPGKRPNSQQEKTLIDHALFLADRAKLGIIKNDLDNINKECKNDFNGILVKMLNGQYMLKNGTVASGLDTDIAIAYLIRNHAAHNVSSVSVIGEKFPKISQRLLNVLFLCVETLY